MLLLFREIIVVYVEKYGININAMYEETEEFLMLNQVIISGVINVIYKL
jgi:hypothetical protein